MNTITIIKSAFAAKVWFSDLMMHILLDDGRELAVPIDWFPKLRDASDKERENFRFIGGGEGIHWEELDEDILVEALLY
jgi:hypothetical protein